MSVLRRPCSALIALTLALFLGGGRHDIVTGSTGSVQLNLGSADLIPANFINVFKVSFLNPTNPADASKFDDDGYLIASPTGTIGINFPSAGTMWTNTTYKLSWDAGVQFSALTFSSSLSSCSVNNATIVSGCVGGGATIASTGGAGSVTFTTSATQFSLFWGPGGTYSHSGGSMALYRLSDEADFLTGEIYTPEFKAVLAGLNPKTIRPMGWVHHGGAGINNETTWNYRNKLSTFTWNGSRYPPGAMAPSAVSGTDTYLSLIHI